MPTPLSDKRRHAGPRPCFWRGRLRFVLVAAGAGLVCFAPHEAWAETATVSRSSQAQPTPAAKATPAPSPKPAYDKKWGKLEGNAVWYDVPVKSLAHRRAGKDELTAAHNRLPLGTMVRVTHLANKKSVIVRITDRGITARRAVIDLCKEAAVKLGMVSEGAARVRLEILPDDGRASALPTSKTTKANP